MSGLAALAGLLDGRTPPGPYRWRTAYDGDDRDDGPGAVDATEVRRTVERAGRRFAHVDGTVVTTVAGMHDALARALDLPAWYGRNLDALADCLSDVPAGTVLLWDAWSALARAEPRVFAIAVDLLGHRLSVLLRGDGPDLDLPLLH